MNDRKKIEVLDTLLKLYPTSYSAKSLQKQLRRCDIGISLSFLYKLKSENFITKRWFISDKGRVELLRLKGELEELDLKGIYLKIRDKITGLADLDALNYAMGYDVYDNLVDLQEGGENIRFHVDGMGRIKYIYMGLKRS